REPGNATPRGGIPRGGARRGRAVRHRGAVGQIISLKRIEAPAPGRQQARQGPSEAARGVLGVALVDALALVEAAAERIWRPAGADALYYLHGRGLSDETIRRHRLRWTPGTMVPTRDEARYFRATGITIPWMDGTRLALAKIRQPEGRNPKY